MATSQNVAAKTARPPVKTSKVTGRRTLRFESYDDLMADAERMAAQPSRTLGNWSQGEIYDHLARAIHGMIDGVGFVLPAPLRPLMRFFMQKKMLTRTLPPGFSVPKAGSGVLPQETNAEASLQQLREAVERAKTEPKRALHPAFGKFTREQWDAFQLRHCEMHMSFIVPVATDK